MEGWVRLHRQMFDNKVWLSEPFTKSQAWIDLFANANHKNGSFFVRGNEVTIKRGQIGWSELTMAKRWQWSRQKVRGFLATLEQNGQIGQQKLYKITTIITIINYDKFQNDTTDRTTERQQKDNRPYTNNNDKNDKNNTPAIAGKHMLKYNENESIDQNEAVINMETGEIVSSREKKKSATRRFDFGNIMGSLESSDKLEDRILALVWKTKGYNITSMEQYIRQRGRDKEFVKELLGYPIELIAKAIQAAQSDGAERHFDWQISTVVKKILTLK